MAAISKGFEQAYIAYVSINIPVGLAYDADTKVTNDELVLDALANFLNHPAITDGEPKTLLHYVDKVDFEQMKRNKDMAFYAKAPNRKYKRPAA